ncbi:NAD-dependent epimerase/dehydratase family protein [Solihabitans fulvus]|nr:NAD-dependent epimerase/dehydratase family protein [Solihabitans fulvus]
MTGNGSGLHVVVGSGGLGRAVASRLRAEGAPVRVVSRSATRPLPAGIAHAALDVADVAVVVPALVDAAVIYNCAAPAYGRWPEEFPALQRGLLAAARACGAVLVSAENTYLYGIAQQPFTEDCPPQPISRKGAVRAAMTAELLAAHRRGDVRVAIGRVVAFYGPHQLAGPLGSRVFGAAVAGRRAKVLGDVDQPHTYVFVDDVAEALVTLGTHDAALGRAWHVPAPPTLTTRELLTLVYGAAGRPLRYLCPPSAAVRAIGRVVAGVGEIAEMLYTFERPTVADDSAYRAAFHPATTSHADAVERTVAWFRADARSPAGLRGTP